MEIKPTELTIRRPDDWHLHLRDGAMLRAVLPHSLWAKRAIIMPNLVPPVVTVQDAVAYSKRIHNALPAGSEFEALMTLYLTENTDRDDVARGAEAGLISAVKLYPAGATTNSDSGVNDFKKVMPVLETMAEIGLPLCVHGEVTDEDIDIFDREKVFINQVLDPIRRRIPELRIVMEHITTAEGVAFVIDHDNMGATITVQHLLLDRNDLLVGGLRPHNYCLPILKRRKHRHALVKTAISGDKKFFLGTDSAPHPLHKKEAECCAAGCFTAPVALPCLAQIFDDAGAIELLEGFVSIRGAEFYGLPVNEDTVTLKRVAEPVSLPKDIGEFCAEDGSRQTVKVFDPGRDVYWRLVG